MEKCDLLLKLQRKFTTEQLEALVDGEAWIAEWNEHYGKTRTDGDFVTCRLEPIVSGCVDDGEHYMTFNGSTEIPTPPEKGE